MAINENIHQRKTPFPVILPEHGVYVFESYHSPEFQMLRSAHGFHELGIVLSGKGTLNIERDQLEEYEILDDYLFYIPPGLPHSFTDHKSFPLTLQMICFKDQILNENFYLKQVYSAFRIKMGEIPVARLGKSYSYQKIIGVFKEMIFEQTQKEVGFEVNLQNMVSSLLVFFNRLNIYDHHEYNTREQTFLDSLGFLQSHFYLSPSIEQLSKMAGQSYRGYTGYFKRKMGKTVLEYITELKVNYAKKRLLESGSIEFSACEAGFHDIPNFYRVFKKFTNMTPKQFLTEHLIASTSQGILNIEHRTYDQ